MIFKRSIFTQLQKHLHDKKCSLHFVVLLSVLLESCQFYKQYFYVCFSTEIKLVHVQRKECEKTVSSNYSRKRLCFEASPVSKCEKHQVWKLQWELYHYIHFYFPFLVTEPDVSVLFGPSVTLENSRGVCRGGASFTDSLLQDFLDLFQTLSLSN